MKIESIINQEVVRYELSFPCYFANEHTVIYFKDEKECMVVGTFVKVKTLEINSSQTWVDVANHTLNFKPCTKEEFEAAAIRVMDMMLRFNMPAEVCDQNSEAHYLQLAQ